MAKLVEWVNPVTKKIYKYHMSSFEFIDQNEDPYARLARAAVATINGNLSYEEFRLCVDDCLVFPAINKQNRKYGFISDIPKDTIHISLGALRTMGMVRRFISGKPESCDQNSLSIILEHVKKDGEPVSISYWKHANCSIEEL